MVSRISRPAFFVAAFWPLRLDAEGERTGWRRWSCVAAPQEASRQTAKKGGPSLQGRIVDEAGQPLRARESHPLWRFATRWKVADRKPTPMGVSIRVLQSSMIRDQEADAGPYVGVRVEHPAHCVADGRSGAANHAPGIAGQSSARSRVTWLVTSTRSSRREDRRAQWRTDLRIMSPTKPHGHGARSSLRHDR